MARLIAMALVLFPLVFLTGCLAPQGNVAQAPLAFNQSMADDSAQLLVSLYPPAHTRFQFKPGPKDAYGLSLMKVLRLKGYSLLESEAKDPEAKRLTYLIDKPIKPHLYRLSLKIDERVLSRAYQLKDNRLHPVATWANKEQGLG